MNNFDLAKPRWRPALAIFLGLFGLLTLKSGSAVLFFDSDARAAAGNYVPFVLWFNFIAGFFYLLTAYAVFKTKPWSYSLALLVAAATILVSFAFALHVLSGGAYEMRTVGALTLRSIVWIFTSLILIKTDRMKTSKAV